MKVGVIGCGVISRAYVENAKAFDSFELVACADLDPTQADALGKASGLRTASVDELIADPSIDVILNLTPAPAHAAVTRQALAAGKHVYTEKPIATEVAEAARARPRGRAPRAAHRLRARHLPRLRLPGGARRDRRGRDRRAALGQRRDARRRPGDLAPEPRHLLRRRRRPALRHGAVLPDGDRGAARPDRARRGVRLDEHAACGRSRSARAPASASSATTPTHTTAAMQLESGVTANLVASFETRGQYVCDLVIHGSEGVLVLPDPNAFEGTVRLKRGRGGWEDVPYASRGGADARGIGLHDMVEAIAAGAAPRVGPARRARRRGRARDPAVRRRGPHRRDRVARRPAAAAAGRQRRLSRRSDHGRLRRRALTAHELVSIQTPSGRACCSSTARSSASIACASRSASSGASRGRAAARADRELERRSPPRSTRRRATTHPCARSARRCSRRPSGSPSRRSGSAIENGPGPLGALVRRRGRWRPTAAREDSHGLSSIGAQTTISRRPPGASAVRMLRMPATGSWKNIVPKRAKTRPNSGGNMTHCASASRNSALPSPAAARRRARRRGTAGSSRCRPPSRPARRARRSGASSRRTRSRRRARACPAQACALERASAVVVAGAAKTRGSARIGRQDVVPDSTVATFQ